MISHRVEYFIFVCAVSKQITLTQGYYSTLEYVQSIIDVVTCYNDDRFDEPKDRKHGYDKTEQRYHRVMIFVANVAKRSYEGPN